MVLAAFAGSGQCRIHPADGQGVTTTASAQKSHLLDSNQRPELSTGDPPAHPGSSLMHDRAAEIDLKNATATRARIVSSVAWAESFQTTGTMRSRRQPIPNKCRAAKRREKYSGVMDARMRPIVFRGRVLRDVLSPVRRRHEGRARGSGRSLATISCIDPAQTHTLNTNRYSRKGQSRTVTKSLS